MSTKKALITSFMAFAIAIIFLYTNTFYGSEIPEKYKLAIGKEKIIIQDQLEPFTIDLRDFYISYIENFIILMCMFLGIYYFFDGITNRKIITKYLNSNKVYKE